jgi:UDP-glucose-4-epimerase GalE
MQTILVTGGAGFIGSHVAKRLAREGFLPVVLDNFSTGNRWAVKWGPLIEGDIRDVDLIGGVVEKYRIEAAIHLAACAYVGESVENPRKYYRNNVIGSLRLLDALIESGVRHVVFSSTCAVYGNSECLAIDESHTQEPVNPYGESKMFVERALRSLDAPHAVKSVCLRYFNAAGADPEGEIGESHDPETHLIPLILQTASGLRDAVSVYGTDYATPDGSAVRDYTHVSDLARAHVLAVRYLSAGGNSAALNLGTGTGHSVLDVVRSVKNISGCPVRTEYLPRRAGDPARLVANAGAAYSLLGWTPAYREIKDAVAHAWKWHQRGPGKPDFEAKHAAA